MTAWIVMFYGSHGSWVQGLFADRADAVDECLRLVALHAPGRPTTTIDVADTLAIEWDSGAVRCWPEFVRGVLTPSEKRRTIHYEEEQECP